MTITTTLADARRRHRVDAVHDGLPAGVAPPTTGDAEALENLAALVENWTDT